MKASRFLFYLGPVLFILLILLPLPLTREQQMLSGVMSLTICWWLSSLIPLAVTGLIAICLCVLTGVTDFPKALSGFSNPVIFLFMGGFFMAHALQLQKLDLWIAQRSLSARFVRGSSRRVMIMTVILTATFSAFLSNTATTAMFMPIGLSLLTHLDVDNEHDSSSVILMIAYAATIGGIATPIGTPPNVLATSLLEKLVNVRIDFLSWMVLMVPVMVVILGGLVLVFWKELSSLPRRTENIGAPPPLTTSQRRVFMVLIGAMILWILPSAAGLILGKEHELSKILTARLPEGLVGLLMGSLCFFIPDHKGSTLLTWKEAIHIDWGTLLLFGAGISLGEIVFETKLATVIGNSLPFESLPLAGGILLITVLTVFGSEFVSNTAIANLLIPLTVATPPFDKSPLVPVLAVTLASSLAFMMPVGTPPNAIAYGTGLVKLNTMLKKGFLLNLISIAVIWFMAQFYF
jgi:sodium-dependent dicarboxylate transporter 2/3/5